MHLHSLGSRIRTPIPALAAIALLTPLLGTALPAPSSASDHASQDPVTMTDPATKTHTVTLVTGDVVTVTTLAGGQQIADVSRPPGAQGGVSLQTREGRIHVIPDEAQSLLAADRLDSRLFDVTALISMGYADARSEQLPLIATYTPATTRADSTPSAPPASRVSLRLPAVRASALVAPKPTVREFWDGVAPAYQPADPTPTLADGIAKLWLDGRVRSTLHESVPQIGAPAAWAEGFDGTGVTVALLDSGLDVHHPDLSTQVADSQSFVPDETIADADGHGTHVGSTIAGTGVAQDGYYKGVAPGATLDVGKVLDDSGFGQDSWLMAGMEWAAEKGDRIVNMSLGDSTFSSDGTDPLAQEVNALSAQYGTLFVIASGNGGPQTVTSPGTASAALTVGAVDKQDRLASFSSGGPVAGPSGAIKPDLVAPGVAITAAKSGEMNDGSTTLYRSLDGTSMATPHVAGSAAILAGQHPGWTGQQLKDQLMSTTKGLANYTPYDVGSGRVDVAAAVRNRVRATGSLSFGNYLWPHDASQVATTQKIIFSNEGDRRVTLDLALQGDDNGFTLRRSTVRVRAHGIARVRVTGDPQTADIGTHGGWVVGTDRATGEPVTRTAVGLVKEDERYDLTLSLKDRSGRPASGYVTLSKAGTGTGTQFVDGSTTLRVPPGTYGAVTTLDVQGEGPDRSGTAVLVNPEVPVHGDTEITLDASEAKLLDTKAPQASVASQRKVDLDIIDGQGTELRNAYRVPLAVDDLYVSPTRRTSEGSFLLTTRWRMQKSLLDLSVKTAHGTESFPTLVQVGSALGTRTDTAATVYAGDGSSSAFQRVNARGKIAVVDRTDAVSATDQVSAAQASGAIGLIVVNDGIGGLSRYVGEAAIPVASVHRDAGARLIALAQHGARATLVQRTYSPFVYDLTRDYAGRVPDQPLVYHPKKRELAKINAHYYAASPADVSAGYRYDVTLTPSLGGLEPEPAPATRVEWVTPRQSWAESHVQKLDTPYVWEMSSGSNSYRAGQTVDLDWFRPAVGPGFSDAFVVRNSRSGDRMTWNAQSWSSFSRRMRLGGYLQYGLTPTALQVFEGDSAEPFYTNPRSGAMQGRSVPPGLKSYRVVLDQERPDDVFRLSTRAHSEWTFMSDTVPGNESQPFSVLKLGYRLDTDLTGDVEAGTKQRITVYPTSSTDQAVPGTIGEVTLKVSFDDGTTWNPLSLTRGRNGGWRGTFTAPASGGYVSVQGSASTDAGYSASSEIIRAYGVS